MNLLEAAPERGGETDPQRQLVSRQMRERIEQVLTGMTPRERMVFELRHYQGMRLRAIGDVLGTSEEAAKNCLFRATQKICSRLDLIGGGGTRDRWHKTFAVDWRDWLGQFCFLHFGVEIDVGRSTRRSIGDPCGWS